MAELNIVLINGNYHKAKKKNNGYNRTNIINKKTVEEWRKFCIFHFAIFKSQKISEGKKSLNCKL